MQSTEQAIDALAIELYEQDGMVILAYDNAMQSWIMDRETIRQRYRQLAAENMADPMVKRSQDRLSGMISSSRQAR